MLKNYIGRTNTLVPPNNVNLTEMSHQMQVIYGSEMRRVRRVYTWIITRICIVKSSAPRLSILSLQPSTRVSKVSHYESIDKERRFPCARWTPSVTEPHSLEIQPDATVPPVPWLTTDPKLLDLNSTDEFIQNCKPVVVILHPGQVLYLPALWFHAVFQTPNEHGLCIAVNYWYDMDFTSPIYPLINFLRHSSMLEDGREDEISMERSNA